MTLIKNITIHCAATREGQAISPVTVNKWGIKRFGQPSYHYIIGLDGEFIKPLGNDQRGAHVARNNTGNIGICYVGGLDKTGKKAKDTRTTAQKRAMRSIIRTLQERHKLGNQDVRGHRDWPGVAKDCPSFDVAAWLAAGMPIE